MNRDRPKHDLSSVTQASVQPQRFAPSYVLVVTEGPDKGSRFTVDDSADQSRVLVGQSQACGVRLTDPRVSRRHAALEVLREGLRFTDLGSKNGSFVNGVKAYDVVVRGGEAILIGETVLQVQPGGETMVPLGDATRFGNLIGASPEMRRLYPLFERIAASDISLVIEGETGTGKEVLAEAIHEASGRASGPFVVLDCTTVSPTLVESTLFGHERGAFTGAIAAQRGAFEEADHGTLFIDEIGELELAMQAKLLRAIERSQVRRIGGKQWLQVNVRIIAATRRNLDAEVQAARFRDDLLFRLSVARVELPPLRRRQGDVSLLASIFWSEMRGAASELTPHFLACLETYDWPGNVRELRNAIAKRIALGDLAPMQHRAQPVSAGGETHEAFVHGILQEELPLQVARERVIHEFEEHYVKWMLDRHGGRVGHAAQAAGVSRRHFQTLRGRCQD